MRGLTNAEEGSALTGDAACDIAVGIGSVMIIAEQKRNATAGVEGHGLVLRNYAQKRETCGVDGIVNGLME